MPKGIAAIRVDCPAFDPKVVRHTRHTVRRIAIVRNGLRVTGLGALATRPTDLRQAKINWLVRIKWKIGKNLAQPDS